MFRRAVILLVLGAFNAALFSRMLWGSAGVMEYRRLKDQLADMREQVVALDRENLAISKEIRLIQSDRDYAEKMVRQKLHYLRDNEIVYMFAEPVEKSPGATANDGKN